MAARRVGMVLLVAMLVAPASGHASSPGELMLAKIDKVRRAHGLPALRDSRVLSRSARRYSSFMLKRDYFGHVGHVRTSKRFRLRGEILDLHYGWRYGVRRTLRALMRSPSHRVVILSRRYRYAGAGVARGRMGRRLVTTWTIHFGRR
jgi:uncharacterized protein YkwD